MRRRQRIRNLTILVTVVVIVVSLVVGLYIALSAGNTGIDRYIGQTVSANDLSTLYQISHGSFGPSGASLLSSGNLRSATGSPYTSNGKPIVVYIGGEYCPYCAVERWSLILSLSRFGNFSNLHYMTSAANELDLATFTFQGSSYSSKYLVFQGYEQEDRSRNQLATVPVNYTKEFTNTYPYVNFGNKFILQTLIPDIGIISGKNWTQIMTSISTGDAIGNILKEGANDISALICNVTGGQPSSICANSSVSSGGSGFLAPSSSMQLTAPVPSTVRPSPLRREA